jgi:hypothetical protein
MIACLFSTYSSIWLMFNEIKRKIISDFDTSCLISSEPSRYIWNKLASGPIRQAYSMDVSYKICVLYWRTQIHSYFSGIHVQKWYYMYLAVSGELVLEDSVKFLVFHFKILVWRHQWVGFRHAPAYKLVQFFTKFLITHLNYHILLTYIYQQN